MDTAIKIFKKEEKMFKFNKLKNLQKKNINILKKVFKQKKIF